MPSGRFYLRNEPINVFLWQRYWDSGSKNASIKIFDDDE
jgi:hypothetical protein